MWTHIVYESEDLVESSVPYAIHVHIQKAYKIVWLGIWRLDWDLRFIIQRVLRKSLYDRVPVSTLRPRIRTQLPSLHPPVTNLLMYWILPILQASHIGAMWYKRMYAPLSVETCMNNSMLQYHDMLVGYILIVSSAQQGGAAEHEIVFCVNVWPSKIIKCVCASVSSHWMVHERCWAGQLVSPAGPGLHCRLCTRSWTEGNI